MRNFKKTFLLYFFILSLFIISYADNIPCEWRGIGKVIAVGDIHGDYKNFVRILRATGLIDENLHWKGKNTHFVQTGDVMDRGPNAKKVLDLIMKLQKEAEKAGGKVHMLIGNHEEMNITGIALEYKNYVTPEQFISFLPEKYREKREKKIREEIKNNASAESLDSRLIEFWTEVMKNDREAKRNYIINFNKNYGKWITKQNAVIKINDIVFVHGGINEKFSTWKIEDINKRARFELETIRIAILQNRNPQIDLEIVYKPDGPFWFRDFALKDEEIFKEEVDKILKNLNVNYMIIAHTPQIGSKIISEEYVSRFQKKIWIIDTGISDSYGGFLSALIIENGNFSLWGELNEK